MCSGAVSCESDVLILDDGTIAFLIASMLVLMLVLVLMLIADC